MPPVFVSFFRNTAIGFVNHTRQVLNCGYVLFLLYKYFIGLNFFYFICTINIVTNKYKNNELEILYKWDAEGSQNLFDFVS